MKLNEIRMMNDTRIIYLKKIGKTYERNEIIKKILLDDACFFKMCKDDACIILRDLGIGEDKVNDIYCKLISSDEYYELYKSGKINENDKELKIKYKIYDSENLF